MPISPDALTADAEATERLGETFDFRIETDPREPVWFSVDGAEDFRRIGRDSAGGAFVLLSGSQRVLYALSEGAAGIVAADFDAFIQLIVACSYWRDILKFSANGDCGQMRRAAAALEAAQDDEEELGEARDTLKSQLGLAEPADPVGALHRAVSTSDVIVRTPDGGLCATLFDRFSIDDNPWLRDFAD